MPDVVKMLEAELQDSVIDLAHHTGWLVAHFRPARTLDGWRTPVAADGKGFPDLTLARSPELLFVELKGERGRVSVEQQLWLDVLGECSRGTLGFEVHVWRPQDWRDGTIERRLRRWTPVG